MNQDKNTCPICNSIECEIYDNGHRLDINCVECGKYRITEIAYHLLISKNVKSFYSPFKIANASSWLRENQIFPISTNNIDELFNHKTPSLIEKAEKLMLYISRKYPVPGQYINDKDLLKPLSITWSINEEERSYILHEYLVKEKKFLSLGGNITITPTGWSYLDSLNKIFRDSKDCFVAMWFDDSTSDLWSKALYPAIEMSGFNPVRIDFVEHNNQIVDEILASINRSRFVVADFTGNRGSVYFEAGYALGQQKQVIFTCKNTGKDDDNNDFKKLRFDIEHFRFTFWRDDEYEDFKSELQNRIEATIVGE